MWIKKFLPIVCNAQDLIATPVQPKREPLDTRLLSGHDNSKFILYMIYVGLPWVSEWLVALVPFFLNKRGRTQVCMGFYAWFSLFGRGEKGNLG